MTRKGIKGVPCVEPCTVQDTAGGRKVVVKHSTIQDTVGGRYGGGSVATLIPYLAFLIQEVEYSKLSFNEINTRLIVVEIYKTPLNFFSYILLLF